MTDARTDMPTTAADDAQRKALIADLRIVALKTLLIVAAAWAALTFAFGLYRVDDVSMDPALRDCDLVLYWRLGGTPSAGDLAVFSTDGEVICSRVVAGPGDRVDIDADGLIINGAHQIEEHAYGETTQVADGVTFPLTVGEDQVFVLGDNREAAIDSRIVGCVDNDGLLGTVIGIFRRRNF